MRAAGLVTVGALVDVYKRLPVFCLLLLFGQNEAKSIKTDTTDTKLLITQEQFWRSVAADGYHTNTTATEDHVRTSF